MKGIIVSATSDIATQMALRWKKKNWEITGTYYSTQDNYKQLTAANIPLIHCNLNDSSATDKSARLLTEQANGWDFILFATGSQSPVGLFEKVEINQVDQPEENRINVVTNLVSKDDKKEMIYKFYKNGPKWMVYDVEILGVSIVATYRSQFASILKSGTVEDLLKRLRSGGFEVPTA